MSKKSKNISEEVNVIKRGLEEIPSLFSCQNEAVWEMKMIGQRL